MLCPLLAVVHKVMKFYLALPYKGRDIVLRIIIGYSPFEGFYPLETR